LGSGFLLVILQLIVPYSLEGSSLLCAGVRIVKALGNTTAYQVNEIGISVTNYFLYNKLLHLQQLRLLPVF